MTNQHTIGDRYNMLVMHQDAIHKRQPEITPEKADSLKPILGGTFTEQSGLAPKGNNDQNMYP